MYVTLMLDTQSSSIYIYTGLKVDENPANVSTVMLQSFQVKDQSVTFGTLARFSSTFKLVPENFALFPQASSAS